MKHHFAGNGFTGSINRQYLFTNENIVLCFCHYISFVKYENQQRCYL